MKRLSTFALVVTVFLTFTANPAWSQKKITNQSSEDSLPIPGYKLPMNLSAWRRNLTVQKVTYNKEDNQVVFLVKAKKNFTFKDDGYDAIFEFLDEEGVNLVKEKNLTWDKPPKDLRVGESTRVYLNAPDEDILNKTKKTRAVVKGFFNK
jgi:hypothetical protein